MKIKNLGKILLFAILICKTTISLSQENKNVTIVVSGSGNTHDLAIQNALRSAISQSFGTFISTKTEILNDELISDQITSISNGNINSYSILNESQLPDGRWTVTLKAIVSIEKLTSFVESKGVVSEIKGSLFSFNIKQNILNEEAEKKIIFDLISLVHTVLQKSFDYEIKCGSPKSVDNSNSNFVLPIEISVMANSNIEFCENLFIKTLTSISLSKEEVKNYQSLNKKVYPIYYKSKTFFLRKKISAEDLSYINNWNYYTKLFTIKTNNKEITNGFNEINVESDMLLLKGYSSNDVFYFFPKNGQKARIIKLNQKMNLNQIKQISLVSINPMSDGLVQIKNGGIVISENGGHGLVTSLSDLEIEEFPSNNDRVMSEQQFANENKKNIKDYFSKISINGYKNWRLPTLDEFKKIQQNKYKNLRYGDYYYKILPESYETIMTGGYPIIENGGRYRPVRTF